MGFSQYAGGGHIFAVCESALQIFPLKSVPEFTRVAGNDDDDDATPRNWLGSQRSFADVTTRKRRNKAVNGRREARDVGGCGTRERKKDEGGIYWPEYLRGVELDAPPPKSRSWLSPLVCVSVCVCARVYIHMYFIHTRVTRV